MGAGSPVLQACAEVDVSPHEARRWFLALDEHPERYQSATHGGFVFTKGSFGEEGAQFETRERFAGVCIRLRFRLTKVSEERFAFSLQQPPLAVWGGFEIEPAQGRRSRLSLLIGGASGWARWFLRLPMVRSAVQQQILREVEHVKSSMERLYAQGAV